MTTPGSPPHPVAGATVDHTAPASGDAAAALHQLLGIATQLAAELAATQIAVQELTAQIARAGIAPPTVAALGQAPVVAPPMTNGQVAADPAAPSALAPRRGDHAVASEGAPADDAASAPQPPPEQPIAPVVPAGPEPAQALTAVRPLEAEWTATPPRDGPAAPAGLPISPFDAGRAERAPSLADVPLLSAGSVDVLMGPVRSLTDLDAVQGRIIEMPGVEAATVTAFEGHDVLMSVDLDRPLPLASMLRTELGRDVESCRLVEGRIVVTFGVEGRPA
jgi:hypothetical protein